MKQLKYDISKCVSCRTSELVCCAGHSESKELFVAVLANDDSLPRVKVGASKCRSFPVACRHCDEPKCVVACISNALIKNTKTGMVDYDKDKCVGCWMCVMSCPYGAIRPNHKTKKVIRCDLCADVDTPRCAQKCPVKAIILEEVETK